MSRSSCAGLPIEECMLAQTCQWTKQSARAKPHCRQIPAWTSGGTGAQGNALQEFRQYLQAWRANHPQVPFREAQKMASADWHKERGTTKAVKGVRSTSAQGSGRDWQLNPLFGQQLGGDVDRAQLNEYWNYVSDRLGMTSEDDEYKEQFFDDLIAAAGDQPISRTAFTIAHAMWHGDGYINPDIFSTDKKKQLAAINEGQPVASRSIMEFLGDYLDQVKNMRRGYLW